MGYHRSSMTFNGSMPESDIAAGAYSGNHETSRVRRKPRGFRVWDATHQLRGQTLGEYGRPVHTSDSSTSLLPQARNWRNLWSKVARQLYSKLRELFPENVTMTEQTSTLRFRGPCSAKPSCLQGLYCGRSAARQSFRFFALARSICCGSVRRWFYAPSIVHRLMCSCTT